MSFALAQPQLDAIADACRRHHVARMDVFGSALRSDYRPGESDIDLRLGLASQVDLVMADAVRNPYVKQSIEASKQQIYAACPRAYLSDILEAAAAIQEATRTIG